MLSETITIITSNNYDTDYQTQQNNLESTTYWPKITRVCDLTAENIKCRQQVATLVSDVLLEFAISWVNQIYLCLFAE